MLTTVRVMNTNVISYIYAQLMPDYELYEKKRILQNGETEEEYSQRQTYIMGDSQSNALQAAYRKAGVPFSIEKTGTLVLRVSSDMPAAGILLAGDYILGLDEERLHTREEIMAKILEKSPGDEIQVLYRRKGEERTAKLVVGSIESSLEGDQTTQLRPAIGVSLAEIHSIKAEDEDKQVSIHANDIGGPSAGLMFALEIYSRLNGVDWTKGYKVAGTGTIDSEGNVGVIGGIQHKIVAAHREGADIFFAPADLLPEGDQSFRPILNYSDAAEKARKINTEMLVIPVHTIEDALEYLETLPFKMNN